MNRAVCNVLTNDAALHYKYDAANSCDVFQRIAIEGNDVGLQARCDGANLEGWQLCHRDPQYQSWQLRSVCPPPLMPRYTLPPGSGAVKYRSPSGWCYRPDAG